MDTNKRYNNKTELTFVAWFTHMVCEYLGPGVGSLEAPGWHKLEAGQGPHRVHRDLLLQGGGRGSLGPSLHLLISKSAWHLLVPNWQKKNTKILFIFLIHVWACYRASRCSHRPNIRPSNTFVILSFLIVGTDFFDFINWSAASNIILCSTVFDLDLFKWQNVDSTRYQQTISSEEVYSQRYLPRILGRYR